ncbi:hypothetical protein [Dongia sedimenti]|uniref:Uncharacterized protein n=1 Tax=Dongia sedimenti TaxID=3064282 RepID=A0ABU0YK42_9PROT|nr:hypothetical protein [Rhodospirillaceae bacterium R-7]
MDKIGVRHSDFLVGDSRQKSIPNRPRDSISDRRDAGLLPSLDDVFWIVAALSLIVESCAISPASSPA